MAARCENESECGDEAEEKSKPKRKSPAPKKKPKETKSKKTEGAAAPKETESEWKYGSIRSEFIEKQRASGHGWQAAKSLWDDSEEKAKYLGAVSVPELKRRKFIGKGETVNPWRERLGETSS